MIIIGYLHQGGYGDISDNSDSIQLKSFLLMRKTRS
jgi:hypothetical protein